MKILSAVERVLMLFSYSKRVDGLWIGVFGNRRDRLLLSRVESALILIKAFDPMFYTKVHKRITRIWITDLAGARGSFDMSTRWCNLDRSYVIESPPEFLASTIVHEATHASPCLMKFSYFNANVHRIEKICMRRQLAFAVKLPNGQMVCDDLEQRLALPEDFWSQAVRYQRELDSTRKKMQELGIREWEIKVILFLARQIMRRASRQ